jgi:hypothetical protein
MRVRYSLWLIKKGQILLVLTIIFLAILLVTVWINNSNLIKQVNALNSKLNDASYGNATARQNIGALNTQLSESKTNYTSLIGAVLNDDAHAQEIGRRLQISCDPSSPMYIKPVNEGNLTSDQLKARCGQSVDDVFIDDYIQQNGNIQ